MVHPIPARHRLLLVAVLFSLVSGEAAAQTIEPRPVDSPATTDAEPDDGAQRKRMARRPPMIQRDGLSLGVAGSVRSDIYVGEREDIAFLPTFVYRRGRFDVSARGLFWRALTLDRGALAVGATLRRSEIDESGAPELDGLERSLAFEGTLTFTLRTGFVLWRAVASADASGEHDGVELVVQAGVPVPLPGVFAQLFVGASWQSEALSSWLYGVGSTESTPARPTYEPGEAIVPYAGALVRRAFGESWEVLLNARVSALPQEATASPIVDVSLQGAVLAGINYRF